MKNRRKVLNYKNYCSLTVLLLFSIFSQRLVESGIFSTFTLEYDRGDVIVVGAFL